MCVAADSPPIHISINSLCVMNQWMVVLLCGLTLQLCLPTACEMCLMCYDAKQCYNNPAGSKSTTQLFPYVTYIGEFYDNKMLFSVLSFW